MGGGYKRPFAEPQAVLADLSRYTRRVAIANSRLVVLEQRGVAFRWKDYRDKGNTRHKAMMLKPEEFMRRFLLHGLPGGFHRIRHFGRIANNRRREKLGLARELLKVGTAAVANLGFDDVAADLARPGFVCAHRGGQMIILHRFVRGRSIRAPTAVPDDP